MSDVRALYLSGNNRKQMGDADALLVGIGVKGASGVPLLLTPGSGQTVRLPAGVVLDALAGSGGIDLSAATGQFKTPTGASNGNLGLVLGGNVDGNSKQIKSLAASTTAGDAISHGQSGASLAGLALSAPLAMSAAITMGGTNKITGIAAGTAAGDVLAQGQGGVSVGDLTVSGSGGITLSDASAKAALASALLATTFASGRARVSTTLTTGTGANVMSLADSIFTSLAAGGSARGTLAAGVVAGSFTGPVASFTTIEFVIQNNKFVAEPGDPSNTATVRITSRAVNSALDTSSIRFFDDHTLSSGFAVIGSTGLVSQRTSGDRAIEVHSTGADTFSVNMLVSDIDSSSVWSAAKTATTGSDANPLLASHVATIGAVAGSSPSPEVATALLGTTAAADSPYPIGSYAGQSGFAKATIKHSDGDDVLLRDVLTTAAAADIDAKVFLYLSYRSDLGANLKWRGWFYYRANATGFETPFVPDVALTNVELWVPQVWTGDQVPASLGLLGAVDSGGQAAAALGAGVVGSTELAPASVVIGKIGTSAIGAGLTGAGASAISVQTDGASGGASGLAVSSSGVKAVIKGSAGTAGAAGGLALGSSGLEMSLASAVATDGTASGLSLASGLAISLASGNTGLNCSAGLKAVADAARGLSIGASGVGLDLAADPALEFSSSALRVKLMGSAGTAGVAGALERNASGLAVSLATNSGLSVSSGLAIAPASGAPFTVTSGLALTLESSQPSLQISSAQLGLKIDGSGGLQKGASGVAIKLDTASGLQLGAGGLSVVSTGDAANVISGLDTTTNTMLSGQLGAVSTVASRIVQTDAADISTAMPAGCYGSTAGSLSTGPKRTVRCTGTGGSAPANGSMVYVAVGTEDSGAGAGKVTKTAPSASGQARVAVGMVLDNGAWNSGGTGTVDIVWQPNVQIEVI